MAVAGPSRLGSLTWEGPLELSDVSSGAAPDVALVRVVLSPAFPEVLPEIFLADDRFARPVPHVESCDRLCIAPSTGILLDVGRPAELVRDALDRAVKLLRTGREQLADGSAAAEFATELSAYWPRDTAGNVWCIVNVAEPLAPHALLALRCDVPRGAGAEAVRRLVVGEDAPALSKWLANAGVTPDAAEGTAPVKESAFLLPLATPFVPPRYDEPATLGQCLDLLRDHAAPGAWPEIWRWLATAELPATLLFTIPHAAGALPGIAALHIPLPERAARERAAEGFRPGRVPVTRLVGYSRAVTAQRPHVVRLDAPFVHARGGAEHRTALVTVIGCGAIGSFVAEQLALGGVARLRLIDPELLEAENVHRHALGVPDLDRNKAEALSRALQRRFPHLDVAWEPRRAESVLDARPDFILESDLVILTIGDETAERRLNARLSQAALGKPLCVL